MLNYNVNILQSAIFDFSEFFTLILIFICACQFLRLKAPKLVESNKKGFMGLFYKAAIIGERKSEWVAICLIFMAIHCLFIKK